MDILHCRLILPVCFLARLITPQSLTIQDAFARETKKHVADQIIQSRFHTARSQIARCTTYYCPWLSQNGDMGPDRPGGPEGQEQVVPAGMLIGEASTATLGIFPWWVSPIWNSIILLLISRWGTQPLSDFAPFPLLGWWWTRHP